jgi:hypothetical protein
MGNRYSFVESSYYYSDISIKYHVSLLKIPSKEGTPYDVTSFTYNGDTVLRVRISGKLINYKICKALFSTLNEEDTITHIGIENDTEYTVYYNDNTTDTYIKHINVRSCFRDTNYYLIKINKNNTLNPISSGSSEY